MREEMRNICRTTAKQHKNNNQCVEVIDFFQPRIEVYSRCRDRDILPGGVNYVSVESGLLSRGKVIKPLGLPLTGFEVCQLNLQPCCASS